jgi:hypothetical protein
MSTERCKNAGDGPGAADGALPVDSVVGVSAGATATEVIGAASGTSGAISGHSTGSAPVSARRCTIGSSLLAGSGLSAAGRSGSADGDLTGLDSGSGAPDGIGDASIDAMGGESGTNGAIPAGPALSALSVRCCTVVAGTKGEP